MIRLNALTSAKLVTTSVGNFITSLLFVVPEVHPKSNSHSRKVVVDNNRRDALPQGATVEVVASHSRGKAKAHHRRRAGRRNQHRRHIKL